MSVAIVGIFAFASSAGLSFVFGIPEPRFHDEFSYLLAGDTFTRGRLANAVHPLWIHFESFHILQQPTYASKFPPGQGLVLALGKVIGGHPIVGVWASMGLACAAICWMLQAWLPRHWALFGALLGLVQVRFSDLPLIPAGVFGYWSQSYWGGSLATLGGALVFGALPRIMRRPLSRFALLFGLGLAILANTRPFEGLVVGLFALGSLLIWSFCRSSFPRHLVLKRVLLPLVILLACTVGAMAFYNYRVVGNPIRFPYLVHSETYLIAPLFIFQSKTPNKTYNHERLREFHTGWELKPYERLQSVSGLLLECGKKLVTLWGFYIGPLLTVPLITMLPFVWRNKWMRLALATCSLLIVALLMVNWVLPHYAAPITGLSLLLGVQALRHLRIWTWKGRPVGRDLAYAIPTAMVVSFLLFLALQITYPQHDWSNRRAQIMAQLNHQDGRHLVIVRYGNNLSDYLRNHAEWVYNEADIDQARVVWAREMDPEHNRKLLDYFKGRRVWLLMFGENNSANLLPYPAAPG